MAITHQGDWAIRSCSGLMNHSVMRSLRAMVKPSTALTNDSLKSLIARVSSGPLMYLSTGVSLTSGNTAKSIRYRDSHTAKATGISSSPWSSQRPDRVSRGRRWPLPASSVAQRGRCSRTTPVSMTPGPLTEATLVRPSERSLAAVVVRSSMIAIDHDREPGDDAAPTFWIWRAATTGLPRPGSVDERGDGRHRQRRHRALVDAHDDRPAGHRQLNLAQHLPRVRPIDRAASTVVGRDRADAVPGDPHEGGQRVDEGQDHGRRRLRCRRTARAAAGSRTRASSA